MAIRPRVRFEVLQRDGFACRYCGQRPPNVKLHVDHVVPRARGGSDDPGNLITACNRCNHGKAANPIVGIEREEPDTPTRELSVALATLLDVLRPFLLTPKEPLARDPGEAEGLQIYVLWAFRVLMENGDVGDDNLWKNVIDRYRAGEKPDPSERPY